MIFCTPNGVIATSPDAVTWTVSSSYSIPTTNTILFIAYPQIEGEEERGEERGRGGGREGERAERYLMADRYNGDNWAAIDNEAGIYWGS